MTEYTCMTKDGKNLNILNVNDIVLKELKVGDILETHEGYCYKVIKRQFKQIDETKITCDLLVKEVSNFKILFMKKDLTRSML